MDKTEIIGNLTKDPEMRVTKSGINVCTFTVAVNQRQTKAQKEAGQEAPAKFYRVTVWRELADICNKYLAKGRKVYVEGSIDANAYTAQDGSVRASLELTGNNVEFLSSKSDGQSTGSTAASSQQAAPAVQPAQQTQSFVEVEDDDLPF